MKYARVERERRFLVASLPQGIPGEHKRITDWYIEGTRIRLRKVETHAGKPVALKFTQKYRDVNAALGQRIITNVYLNQREFDQLRILGGQRIEKRRFKYEVDSNEFAIDVFGGHLAGLILAEIEFEDDVTMTNMKCPGFAVAEVTEDSFFTGGNLAVVSPADLHREINLRLKRSGGRPG